MKTRIKNINYFIFAGLITTLIFTSCKVPYDPPIKSSGAHYLVVEGYINSNGVPTDIKLSRTRSITWGDTASYINETGAQVIIEDNQNNNYPLNETGGGHYSATYNLNTSNRYRLHIITQDHREYLSEFVACKDAPPIDSVGWKFNGTDVQIFVNTHDPSGQSKFYRWDYTESWEFHSEYYSELQYNPDTSVSLRSSPVYVCYQTRKSPNILVGSSEKLNEDVIHEAPIALIGDHDQRLSVLYSTLVTQFALDSNAYNYWNAMKGNTENVGSIFGTQPNQEKGNIHCLSDTSETVIGYIGAGSIQQARIFISNASMPADWNQKGNCDYLEVPPIKDSIAFYFGEQGFVPIKAHLNGIIVLGYYTSEGPCVDCTLNGSPVKPSFWP